MPFGSPWLPEACGQPWGAVPRHGHWREWGTGWKPGSWRRSRNGEPRQTGSSWTDDAPCDVRILDSPREWGMSAENGMRPVHPGEVLREELDELGLSADALSKALDIPVTRVTMILNGQRGVSADTALRLARYFGTTSQLWMSLQKTWELRRAEIETAREIAERVKPR